MIYFGFYQLMVMGCRIGWALYDGLKPGYFQAAYASRSAFRYCFFW